MKPVFAGALAFFALGAAFVAGSFIEIESDGDIAIETTEGPAEQIGSAIDQATN